jgi:hypothetical protein
MSNKLGIPEKIYQKFETLCGQLSPEVLCCDGEISPAEAQMRAIKIRREWKALEKKIGRKVSQEQIEQEWANRIKRG